MSINHAILGILSYKPMTGYDLKKIMQESSFMHWSGNSNQVYRALLELYDNGLVTNEVCHQDSSPSKKIYTITQGGLTELKRWSQSNPKAPEIKKTFLIQLAWAGQLNNDELQVLLTEYEQEIRGQIAIGQAKKKKGYFSPDRTPRETALWDLIHENTLSSYTGELDWINKVRQTLNQFDSADYESGMRTISMPIKEDEKMTYKVVEKDNQKYILIDTIGKSIRQEQDGLDLIAICAENGTNLLLIQGERLSDDFMRLSTGIAGSILQKFTNYNIKAVAVLDNSRTKGKFKEFLSESNSGSTFRSYTNFAEAENWLLGKN